MAKSIRLPQIPSALFHRDLQSAADLGVLRAQIRTNPPVDPGSLGAWLSNCLEAVNLTEERFSILIGEPQTTIRLALLDSAALPVSIVWPKIAHLLDFTLPITQNRQRRAASA